jgi:hypothetical protein
MWMQLYYQPIRMQLVQQQHHLQAPTNSKKQKVNMCCLCHHTPNSPTTSAGYCAVASLYSTSHWLVSDLYDIGDTRKKTGNSSIQYKGSAERRNWDWHWMNHIYQDGRVVVRGGLISTYIYLMFIFIFDILIWLQQDSCSKEPHGPPWMTYIILSSSFPFSPLFKLKFAGSDSI